MGEIFGRLVWIIIVVSAVSYGTYLVSGSFFESQAADRYAPVYVRDSLSAGAHHMSGMVMVPGACYELSVEPKELSGVRYHLDFKTWQDPSVECGDGRVSRQFHTLVFAPSAGVDFTAALDGRSMPIVVIPVVPDSKILQ